MHSPGGGGSLSARKQQVLQLRRLSMNMYSLMAPSSPHCKSERCLAICQAYGEADPPRVAYQAFPPANLYSIMGPILTQNQKSRSEILGYFEQGIILNLGICLSGIAKLWQLEMQCLQRLLISTSPVKFSTIVCILCFSCLLFYIQR